MSDHAFFVRGDCRAAVWDKGRVTETWAVTRDVPPSRDRRWVACGSREAMVAAARLLGWPDDRCRSCHMGAPSHHKKCGAK